MTAPVGTHINLTAGKLFTAKVASANQALVSAYEQWKAVQLFMNTITTDGNGTDASLLETNPASMVPTGLGAAVATKVAYLADTLGAVAGIHDLDQG